MLKHANSSSKHYQKLFDPLPDPVDGTLFFDKKPIQLPYSEDFPMLHYHDRYEIGICEKGGGLFLAEGVFSSVSTGDVIFVSPDRCHYSRSLDKEDMCVCRFAFVRAQAVARLLDVISNSKTDGIAALKNAAKCVPPVIHASEHPQAVAIISEIMNSCSLEEPNCGATAALRLAAFILDAEKYFGNTTSAPVTYNTDDAVTKISEYLSLHYNSTDTVQELASKCHLSESQLRRRFIAVYGMPPVAYRNDLRSKIAAELLSRTRLPVSEIAGRIGYAAESDFYRAFVKTYGKSPSEYRKDAGK